MSRILLVDDDELLRNMLRIFLEKMGHIVMEARNGKEAVRLFETEPPDLVLTDLVMPDQDGLETIPAMRRLRPEIKIIAMSGGSRFGPLDYLKIARQMGAVATLNKPFSNEALAQAIAQALAKD
jgi:two-component system chemotaxis response regulator CheY